MSAKCFAKTKKHGFNLTAIAVCLLTNITSYANSPVVPTIESTSEWMPIAPRLYLDGAMADPGFFMATRWRQWSVIRKDLDFEMERVNGVLIEVGWVR
jgi:hypothetical protein